MHNKIITLDEFLAIRNNILQEWYQYHQSWDRPKVIQCHGCFDNLHLGHVEHLQDAASQKQSELDRIIVTVTSDRHVNKGIGRPYFNQDDRMAMLAALECVDYVVLCDNPTPHEYINTIKPDIYCKGAEYIDANNDLTGNIQNDIAMVQKNGGKVHFTTGKTFSSSAIINETRQNVRPEVKEWIDNFKKSYSFDDVKNIIDKMADISVLVVGEKIIDEYVFVKVTGLGHKNHALNTKVLYTDKYQGGTLAIAKHIISFVSVKGSRICGQRNPILKTRYIEKEDGERQQYSKLFSVNKFPQPKKPHDILNLGTEDYDMVMVCDFGHGFFDDKAIKIIQDKAKYLAVMCQCNSDNPYNSITKWGKFDTFTIDEKESKLIYPNINGDLTMLQAITANFSENGIGYITKGSKGSAVLSRTNIPVNASIMPALTLDVADTVGCGDAFYSMASLCSYLNAPVAISLLIASAKAALHSQVLGNSKTHDKVELLQYIKALLK